MVRRGVAPRPRRPQARLVRLARRRARADGGPPNDWVSAFEAVGRAWTCDDATGQWYLHSFLPEQPDLNWDNPEVEAAMHDVLRFWLDRGVDGFRIDVVPRIAKDPELRDQRRRGPRATTRTGSRRSTSASRRMRAMVDEYDDRMLVGEVYLLDLDRVVAYVNSGRRAAPRSQLHVRRSCRGTPPPSARRSTTSRRWPSDVAWPAWFLSNHDHPRVASRFDDGGLGQARARAVLLLLYALRGTPFVYQGEELGLPDATIPPERVVDVDGRDPERAPIPWERPSEAGPGAGFTTGDPWLPLHAEAERYAVAAQRDDPASTFSLARRLAWLRRGDAVLQTGDQRTLDAGDDLLAWVREGEGGRWLAAMSFATAPRGVALAGEGLPARGELVVSTVHGRPEEGTEVTLDGLELAAGEAVLVRLA